MHGVRYPVGELRQYTLRPGQRDVLIDLFDREFVETQETAGMAIVGQFRDLDKPDRFVWIRGFASMPSRAQALASFYGGPVWKAHRAQANATMIDTGNVLLLRPVTAGSGFPPPAAGRPHRAPALPGARDDLLPRPPVRRGIRGLLRPPRPTGTGQGGSRAAGVLPDRARREHLPGAAGPHRRERLRLVRAVPEPGPPQRPRGRAGAPGSVAGPGASRPAGKPHQRA